jgi:hypothetical protein
MPPMLILLAAYLPIVAAVAWRSSSRYSPRATAWARQRRISRRLLPWGGAAGHTVLGRLVPGLADHDDGVQDPVQLPVPASVEAVADQLAGGGRVGATPATMTRRPLNAADLGCDQLLCSWAAVTGPTPDWASSTGAITCTSTCLASC